MGSHRQIEQAAAAWLARRDLETWSDADEATLSEWLSASLAHRIAFVRLESAWVQTRRLKAIATELTRHGEPFSADPPQAPLPSASAAEPDARGAQPRHFPLTAIAAVILIISIVGALWFVTAHPGASYRTAIGSIKAVPMNDGSTVTLNTDSGIRVAMSDTERRVDLEPRAQ